MVHNALNAQSTTVSNAKALKYAQNVKVDTTFNLILWNPTIEIQSVFKIKSHNMEIAFYVMKIVLPANIKTISA